ncbi:hypothetical protein RA279_27670 [Pseudomonas syringae pv. tagetis]|uniref:hypothetical protein n=1 Tax=Pseudomonas syringae group genomosp. 7 TaxID=251699 RepID=UPI00376FE9F0
MGWVVFLFCFCFGGVVIVWWLWGFGLFGWGLGICGAGFVGCCGWSGAGVCCWWLWVGGLCLGVVCWGLFWVVVGVCVGGGFGWGWFGGWCVGLGCGVWVLGGWWFCFCLVLCFGFLLCGLL